MRTVIAALAAALLAGCASTGAPEPAPPAIVATSAVALAVAPAAPKCADVLRPGVRVEVDATGQLACLDPDGAVQVVGVQRCSDGTHLGSVSATTGAPAGWFVAPGPFRAVTGELAADKGFSAAYAECG